MGGIFMFDDNEQDKRPDEAVNQDPMSRNPDYPVDDFGIGEVEGQQETGKTEEPAWQEYSWHSAEQDAGTQPPNTEGGASEAPQQQNTEVIPPYKRPPEGGSNWANPYGGYQNYQNFNQYTPDPQKSQTYQQQPQQPSYQPGPVPNQPPRQAPYGYQPYKAPSPQGQPPKKSKGLIIFVCVLCVAVLGSAIGLSIVGVNNMLNHDSGKGTTSSSSGSNADVPPLTIQGGTSGGDEESLNAKEVAKKVKPSVVGIVSYANGATNNNGLQQSGSEGSGIIMSKDGYIITNAHVVSSKNNLLKVILIDKTEYPAKLIGMDSKTDLAVIKVDAENLNAAEFGDSTLLEEGETVMAIGNPGGQVLAGSVTKGIVSALNRQMNSDNLLNYIQIDAAINPGNSGGALVNMDGRVVGINTSKIVAEGYEGIGFSIPIAEAKPILDDLLKNGYVTDRVKLGITCQTITDVTAEFFKVPSGLMIQAISEDSDLLNQGVVVGDIITKVEGSDIEDINTLYSAMEGKKAGETIRLTIYRTNRNGLERTFDVNVKLIEDRGE